MRVATWPCAGHATVARLTTAEFGHPRCRRAAVAGVVAAAVLGLVAATAQLAAAAPESPDGRGRTPPGGVVVQPVDPHGRVNPPAVQVDVDASASPPVVAPATGRRGRPRQQPAIKGPRIVCRYLREPALESTMRRLGAFGVPLSAQARLYVVSCGDVLAGFVWLTGPPPDPTPQPARRPSALQLAQTAVGLMRLSRPVIATSPGRGVAQLVGVPTWLWVDQTLWRPRSVTVSVPGLSATATATPTGIEWSTGDGDLVRCAGPGQPYRPGIDDPGAGSPQCSHTYTRSGPMVLTATVTWLVRWTSRGATAGPRGGTLEPLHSSSGRLLRVIQAWTANAQPDSAFPERTGR